MTNLSSPMGSIYNGWFYNGVDGRYDFYVRGTKVKHITATELQVDQALDVDGAANFAGEVETAANLHIEYTLELGTDNKGTDSEQVTSGAASPPDWASAV